MIGKGLDLWYAGQRLIGTPERSLPLVGARVNPVIGGRQSRNGIRRECRWAPACLTHKGT